jgi:hypothetical protein
MSEENVEVRSHARADRQDENDDGSPREDANLSLRPSHVNPARGATLAGRRATQAS